MATKKPKCSPRTRAILWAILRRVTVYSVIYIAIILYVIFAWYIFFYAQIIDYNIPTVSGPSSLLFATPGLSYVPQVDRLTSLIHFKPNRKYSYNPYVDAIIAHSVLYDKANSKEHECYPDFGADGFSSRRVCRFNLLAGGPCNIYRLYGYIEGEPCILLKMNRVYGWIPDLLPAAKGVQVKCNGVTEADRQFTGPLFYHDINTWMEPGLVQTENGTFNHYYQPYLSQKYYEPPLVFLELPFAKRHVVIQMECTLLAKNINPNPQRRDSYVQFDLLID